MANNYTPSYNQYLTQTAGYALPSSVRSYSVFDPSSNSWRKMTNDGRSPMPASPASPVQQQADVAGALAQARQTQGTVYPAQGMTPTQTPGIFLRPANQGQTPPQTPPQAPAQTPLGGPRMASSGQQRGGMGDSPSPASGVPQRGFKASGQPDGYLSAGLSAASQPRAYPEGYRAVVSPDNQVPVYTINRNGLNVPSVSGVSSPEQIVQENVAKAAPPTINVADIAQRGLPEGFTQQKATQVTFKPLPKDIPVPIMDDDTVISSTPNDDYDTVYDETKSNVWKVDPNHPVTKRIGTISGNIVNGMMVGLPVGRAFGQVGKMGIQALGRTKLGQQAINNYQKIYNAATTRGREVANRLADRFYNPQNIGTKGFNKFNFENFADTRVSPSTQAQRLAEFQNNLQNTASIGRPLSNSNVVSKVVTRTPQQARKLQEFRDYLVRPSNLNTPLPPNAIRPLRGFENFSFTGF